MSWMLYGDMVMQSKTIRKWFFPKKLSKSRNLIILMKNSDQNWSLCSVFFYFQALKNCIFGLIRPVKLLQINFYDWKDHYLSISGQFKNIHFYGYEFRSLQSCSETILIQCVLVHLNPFWLVRAEIQHTVHIVCPKRPIR